MVLDALECNGVTWIVLVANAVSDRVDKEIRSRAAGDPDRYRVVESNENVGSAGGYALGLKRALEQPADYLWLLDDDNCPREDCLSQIFQQLQKLAEGNLTAVAASGVDLSGGGPASRGEVGRWPRPGSCIGFHLRNLVAERGNTSDARLDWAAYGGLLLPHELVRRIGFPREEFFLYGDDLEWTARIRRVGGQILACPQAILQELAPTWDTGSKRQMGNLEQRVLSPNPDRVYYEVRNRTWIVRHYFPGKAAVYTLNRIIFLTAEFILALRYRRFGRFLLIYRAIRDGEHGRLGRLNDKDFRALS